MITIIQLITLFPFTILFKSPKDFQVTDIINGFIAGLLSAALQNEMDSCEENPNIQYGGYKCSAVWTVLGIIAFYLFIIWIGIWLICSIPDYVKYGWPKFQPGCTTRGLRRIIGLLIGRTLVRK